MSNENNLDSSLLYHYTNLDALLNGIIVNAPKKCDHICLWASHSDYLNDREEIKLGLSIRNEVMNGDKLLPLKDNVHYDLSKVYILSFSKKRDSLPMWSMYGKSGNGISLCFNSNIVCTRTYLVRDCIYKNDSKFKSILSNLNNPDLKYTMDGKSPFADEGSTSYFIKHMCTHDWPFLVKDGCFDYEEEVRLIIKHSFYNEESNIKFRVSNGLLIPYFDVFFPKTTLSEIIIGPTNDYVRSEFSLRMFLNSKGFEHVIISKSNVPYR